MKDVTKTAYAEWLEKMIMEIMKHKPEKIGFCCLLPNLGGTVTGYFGDCSYIDKDVMCGAIIMDAAMDVLNAR